MEVRGGLHRRQLVALLGAIFPFFVVPATTSARQQSSVPAIRLSQAPKIDGQLDDVAWQQLPVLTDFVQYSPRNGSAASQRTTVQVGYDDTALYVGALCYDDPEKITTEISVRDRHGLTVDIFGLHLSPFNDGINSLFLDVTPAGVQRDLKISGDDFDVSWDAVWESEVSLTETGWVVEMKIPYSAIRFSGQPVQTWGLNLWRWIAREREWSTWSYVDNEVQGWWKHPGELQGLRDLNPPLRLSFTPFVTAYAEHGTDGQWRDTYTGGTDLKYGINDSFTLDVTLIPDFGQVLSDEEELNLTPYEIKFNERRQFFTEGTELFSKADLFYSRRIGGRPVGFDRVYEDLLEYEEVRRNPSSTNLLNATKLSGRTDFGLGIGVLNAMTREAKAWVVDTESGGDRWIVTQPFTNYNLLVLEQTLVPHSYVSLVNSNVWRQNYVANVTGTEVALADRSNTYRVKGIGALSRIQHEERTRNGFKAFVDAGKISGRFQYRYDLSVISDDYDQNDMGYLRRNNEVVHRGSFSHNVFQPFGWFLGMTNQIQWIYSRVYKPSDFSESVFRYDFSADFKNHYYLTAYAAWAPTDRKDYYEPRVPGRFYIAHKFYETGFTVQTDPRQTFSSLFEAQISRAYDYSFDVRSWSALVSPLLRLSDHFQLRLEYFYGVDRNQPGFVDADFENGNIYFGKRDRNTGTATVEAKYMWTNRSSLECRLRHYWSRVTYDSFYLLQEDGGLRPLGRGTGDPFSRDVQYNAFNLDLTYRWEFAPGSELLVNWKNAIYTSDQLLSGGHWHNLRHTLSAPQTNSISIKFLYYLDYLELVGSSRSSR